jgi:predicted phosphodiesterase
VRIAIVSDIHGNLAAFEAVLADLRDTSPDVAG